MISSRALPDQAHSFPKDHVFFRAGDYYCVACYCQIEASKVQEDARRSVIQKAVVAVCSSAIFSVLLPSLEACTESYFSGGNGKNNILLTSKGVLSDRTILKTYFETINENLNALRASELYQGEFFLYLSNT